MANSLRLAIGDKLTVLLPEASVTPAGVLPRLKRFTVKGIFSVGAELDGNYALIHMDDAARLMRTGGKAEGVRLLVRSEEHTSELQSRPHLVCRLLLEKKNKKDT